MKKWILHITFFFLALGLYAQKIPNGELKKADKMFENFEYADAALAYERILTKVPDYEYAKLQLIKCYSKLDLPDKSLPLYANIVRNGSSTASTSFMIDFASVLMQEEFYDRAKEIIEQIVKNDSENELARNYLKGLSNYEQFYLDSARYQVTLALFNSEKSDYAPSLYQNGIVFLSNREDFQIVKAINSWDQLGYHKHYYKSLVDTVDIEKLDNRFDIRFNQGPAFFYNQDSSAIFTANAKDKSEDGSYKLQLYETHKLQNGKWAKPIEFVFNNNQYDLTTPFINITGDSLYFASNMPNGKGGMDIYRSIKVDSQWIEPVNLGELNTAKNELYPYQQNNVLYFASNGHYGLGGLDLYKFDQDKNEVVNLGIPVNSSHDDFALVLDTANNGFFSSSRKNGNGMDDIYGISISKPKSELLFVEFVDEETGEHIENVELKGLMDKANYAFDFRVIEDEKLQIRLPFEHLYNLSFSKEGYITKRIDYQPLENDKAQVNLTIKLLKQLIVTETVVDIASGVALDSVDIVFTHLNNDKIDSLVTDENGYFNLYADRDTHYKVSLRRNGYFNYSKFVTTNRDSLGLILFNLSMEKIDLNKGMEIADIYFELGSVELTPESKKNLDSLVMLMNENPKLTIELGSHTDATGSSLFNLNISERRAIAVANYLSSKGVDAIRLIAKGYGETELLNGCTNGINCTKEEHNTNRRLEFKVLSY